MRADPADPIPVLDGTRIPALGELPRIIRRYCRAQRKLSRRERRAAPKFYLRVYHAFAVFSSFSLLWPVALIAFAWWRHAPGSRVLVDSGAHALLVIRRAKVPIDAHRRPGWLLCNLVALTPGHGYGFTFAALVVASAKQQRIPMRLQAATPGLAKIYEQVGFEIIPAHRNRYMPTMILRAEEGQGLMEEAAPAADAT